LKTYLKAQQQVNPADERQVKGTAALSPAAACRYMI